MTRSARRNTPLLIERIAPPPRRLVAVFGVHLCSAPSTLRGAGNGLFAKVQLRKGTALAYGGAGCRIFASATDALRAGASVSHLRTVRGTGHCIDATPRAGVGVGGAELANQALDSRTQQKLDLNPKETGLEHCALLVADVAAGEEIFTDYGLAGWSFLLSVGFLDVRNGCPCHTPIQLYAEHWLYLRFQAGELPRGPVLFRMKELFLT
jgi:hypothetical protein